MDGKSKDKMFFNSDTSGGYTTLAQHLQDISQAAMAAKRKDPSYPIFPDSSNKQPRLSFQDRELNKSGDRNPVTLSNDEQAATTEFKGERERFLPSPRNIGGIGGETSNLPPWITNQIASSEFAEDDTSFYNRAESDRSNERVVDRSYVATHAPTHIVTQLREREIERQRSLAISSPGSRGSIAGSYLEEKVPQLTQEVIRRLSESANEPLLDQQQDSTPVRPVNQAAGHRDNLRLTGSELCSLVCQRRAEYYLRAQLGEIAKLNKVPGLSQQDIEEGEFMIMSMVMNFAKKTVCCCGNSDLPDNTRCDGGELIACNNCGIVPEFAKIQAKIDNMENPFYRETEGKSTDTEAQADPDMERAKASGCCSHPWIRKLKFGGILCANCYAMHKANRIPKGDKASNGGEHPWRVKPTPYVEPTPKGEELFAQAYGYMDAEFYEKTFHKFMALPKEVRQRVYKHVLQSDLPIAPHLCNATRPALRGKAEGGMVIRFHDDNQEDHNAICSRLTITRVSKTVREESLPVFYGKNTFDVVADTPTYFTHLEQMGRFHMIRHVHFTVQLWNSDVYTQKVLRMILQNIKDQEKFETQHMQKEKEKSKLAKDEAVTDAGEGSSNDTTKATSSNDADSGTNNLVAFNSDSSKFFTDDPNVLKSYPEHLMGGLEANFLVLRKLSAAFKDDVYGLYNRRLVIYAPSAALFEQYKGILYFPSVCTSLGINLQIVSGRELNFRAGGFQLSWHQKYQRKDFAETSMSRISEDEHREIYQRIHALFPNIDDVPRPARRTYYRNQCKTRQVEWFSIDTEDGGV